MATSSTCNDSSNDSKIDDSSRVFRCVLGGILDDDSFSIPTEGNSTCLKLADTMVKMYGAPTAKCKEFGDWLITTLQEIIDTSRRQQGKKKGIINQEKLWSKYHQITTSSNFKDTWETFLSDFRLEKEPVFYQYFTDETFDILIKKAWLQYQSHLQIALYLSPLRKRMPLGMLVVMLYEFYVNTKATLVYATSSKQ